MASSDLSSPQALHALYSDHHGWLRNWLQRRLGNTCDAADLAHDAFLRLLARPRSFDSGAGARAYLSTIARGLMIDLWRRREIERAWLDALAARPEPVDPSPEHRAIVLETLYEIDALLRRLPEKVATAFVLAQLHGLTYREIGARLGVSERMVKKYMAQAMLHCVLMEAEFDAAVER